MISKGDTLTLDYAFRGKPFAPWIKAVDDTGTLDYSFTGAPFNAFLTEDFILVELAGSIAASASISGNLISLAELAGLIEGESEAEDAELTYATVVSLGGLVRGKSKTLTGDLIPYADLSGTIDAQSSVGDAALSMFMELSGLIEGESDLDGILRFLWEESTNPEWVDWDERPGATDEAWILRTDEADDTWTVRSDAADDIWILRTDEGDDSWTERT